MTVQERDALVKKLQKGAHVYAPFCAATRMPFVICDEETFNDQVHLFMETGTLAEFLEPYKEQKYDFTTVEVDSKHRLRFLLNLFSIGVNSVVIHDGNEKAQEAELTELVNMVDYDKMPENERPLINPELQLSAIYFIQELRRPVELLNKEKLVELEEEMSANFVRATYLFPMEIVAEDDAEGNKKPKEIRFPYLKDGSGQMLQPIFTDGAELQKYLKDRTMQLKRLKFTELERYMTTESTGFILNPFGINLVLRKEQIQELAARFQWVEEQK